MRHDNLECKEAAVIGGVATKGREGRGMLLKRADACRHALSEEGHFCHLK